MSSFTGSDQNFDAVGYHYLIDSSGKVYEGRELIYKGSHVLMKNTRKIGILLLGDFNEQWWDVDDKLTNRQLVSLDKMIEVLKQYFNINKLGGHKEFLPGEGYTCPGNLVMDIIGKLRDKHDLQKP
ncbi:peptidoglycan recognition family protein [Vibrio nigripulchritudo]|uniref:peptidoglycan recognition protein family protein n=1 Tax=Vibrio nigripulchritudo TaxID=28173 RepID=UPI0003B22B9B|nr:peptidoglycan recognition family protein [Vibrio nigripulchritudo]CCN70379.1 hypothetical protein VIBNISFn118_2030002 [Vibrio nigripulchritudo SFn118]